MNAHVHTEPHSRETSCQCIGPSIRSVGVSVSLFFLIGFSITASAYPKEATRDI